MLKIFEADHFLGIDDHLRPFEPKRERQDLTKLAGKELLGGPISDEEMERRATIGTLVNYRGEIVSVQDPSRPLKLK